MILFIEVLTKRNCLVGVSNKFDSLLRATAAMFDVNTTFLGVVFYFTHLINFDGTKCV
jgi:hypothetical protein